MLLHFGASCVEQRLLPPLILYRSWRGHRRKDQFTHDFFALFLQALMKAFLANSLTGLSDLSG